MYAAKRLRRPNVFVIKVDHYHIFICNTKIMNEGGSVISSQVVLFYLCSGFTRETCDEYVYHCVTVTLVLLWRLVMKLY